MRRVREGGYIELLGEPVFWILLGIVLVVALLLMPFIEIVGPGEIVVCESRFGNGTEVWRGPADREAGSDTRWQGFCKVTEYHDRAGFNFREDIVVGETNYRVRGTVFYDMPKDDVKLLEIHKAYGSEGGIEAKLARPALRSALEGAASDQDWTKPEGGWAKRQAKSALEYAIKRVSPTGAIWSPHEIQKKLQADLKGRLSGAENPHGIPLMVDLTIVTGR